VAGAGAPAVGRLVEGVVRATKVPVGATGALASATATTTGATVAPPEPSRNRKQGFSSLR
jgi:hypothetical protein